MFRFDCFMDRESFDTIMYYIVKDVERLFIMIDVSEFISPLPLIAIDLPQMILTCELLVCGVRLLSHFQWCGGILLFTLSDLSFRRRFC